MLLRIFAGIVASGALVRATTSWSISFKTEGGCSTASGSGGSFPTFDQQAIETMAMVLMHFQAYETLRQPEYIEKLFLSYKYCRTLSSDFRP